MALSNAAMIVAATALRSALSAAQLHTANPGSGGAANKSSAGMAAPAWTTPTSDGDFDLATPLSFSGGTPNGPVTWVSLWADGSGFGTWYGNFELSGDLTFDSNGDYTIESLALNGSSS